MTLQQLRSFLAIVEHGSLRKAARASGVSQAGLTASLQALEDSLQVELLRRSPHGVSLTEHGQQLLARARMIDREAQRAVDDIQRTRGVPGGTLHVALGPTPTAALLHLVVPDFHARYPQVRLQLTAGIFEQHRQALQQGLIEMAVTALPDEGAGPDLVSRPLFKSDLVVMARRGHARAGARTLAELADCEWVLLGTPGSPGGTVTRFHAEQGLPAPRIAATCESFTQLAALIAGTPWLALLPVVLLQRGLLGSDVVAIDLVEQAPRFSNCIIYRREPQLTPAAQAFAAMCASCARIVGNTAALAPG